MFNLSFSTSLSLLYAWILAMFPVIFTGFRGFNTRSSTIFVQDLQKLAHRQVKKSDLSINVGMD